MTHITISPYRWVNLYALAQVQGFVYYEAYVFVPSATAVGWTSRVGFDQPYSYAIYYEDATKAIQTQTRGTWQHAQWGVQGAIASAFPPPHKPKPPHVIHHGAGVAPLDLENIYQQCLRKTAALK